MVFGGWCSAYWRTVYGRMARWGGRFSLELECKVACLDELDREMGLEWWSGAVWVEIQKLVPMGGGGERSLG
jgi:hypothetical protein